jgi:hypothetical membrane protein
MASYALRRNDTLRALALSGRVAPILFFAIVAMLGYLQEGYDPARQHISQLGVPGAPYAVIQNVNFVVTGALVLAFAVGLYWTADRSRAWRAAALLVGMTGAGMAGAGVFATDPCCPRPDDASFTAVMHGWLALTAFVCVIAAMLIVGVEGLRHDWNSKPYRLYSLMTGVAAIVFLVLTGLADPENGLAGLRDSVGVYQRLFIGAWMLWIEITAVRLHQKLS